MRGWKKQTEKPKSPRPPAPSPQIAHEPWEFSLFFDPDGRAEERCWDEEADGVWLVIGRRGRDRFAQRFCSISAAQDAITCWQADDTPKAREKRKRSIALELMADWALRHERAFPIALRELGEFVLEKWPAFRKHVEEIEASERGCD